MITDILEELDSQESKYNQDQPFGGNLEEAIISLALDFPNFVTGMIQFLKPDLFKRLECKYIIAEILNLYEKYNTIPTRAILIDHIESSMTSSDPFELILPILEKKSNPRDIPLIKDTLLKWARQRSYGLLYSEEAIQAYQEGDFKHIEEIVNNAKRIADIGEDGFWFLDNFELLFQPDAIEHLSTGFPRLDKYLNCGGPSRKEVVCWLAPTNVGKSIMLINNAISSLMNGKDVLFITFEMSVLKTALRGVGAATGVPTDDLLSHQDMVRRILTNLKMTTTSRLLIHEMAPDECGVNHIYALLDSLKRREGWRPEIIVLDYLDLMVSRIKSYNEDDYNRQKAVANEVRGLAINENVLVFTATQTNRSASDGEEPADLKQSAESYGKNFSLDYVVSLNQTIAERAANPPRLRMFIAKNRNGEKKVTINCEINYSNMTVKEV